MSKEQNFERQSCWSRYFCCCWRAQVHHQMQEDNHKPKQNERIVTGQKFRGSNDVEIEMKQHFTVNNNQTQIPKSPSKQSKQSNTILLTERQEESYRQQIDRLQEDIQRMDKIVHKTLQDEDDLAYACANLVNFYILTNDKRYGETSQKALSLYEKRPSLYSEQIITLKNNLALALQKQNKIKEAIQLYSQVLQLEEKYYSISDTRRLSTLNNIFCLYMKYKEVQKGLRIYQDCEPILKTLDEGQQIRRLFRQNYEYYYPQIKEYQTRTMGKGQLK